VPVALPADGLDVPIRADDTRLLAGGDGRVRCRWAYNHPLLRDYHDTEWGFPVRDEQALYERLVLKGFQAGLSCLIVLQKRPALRRAFAGFVPDHVAQMGNRDLDAIALDPEVIRNRAKIDAVRTNAQAVVALRPHGGLQHVVWSHQGARRTRPDDRRQMQAADDLTAALRRMGFRFVGPTSVHAFMQAAGVLPAHLPGCQAEPRAAGTTGG
jgi:DNA-3-methyladenine glycosylase I